MGDAFTEHELVQICMRELCSNSGFADCSNLVQRDLEFICDGIESKTGVLISLSTIKRLFNGQFSRQPQVATLNAMAVYLDYPNWQEFRRTKLREKNNLNSIAIPTLQQKESFIRTPKPFSKYLVITIILVLAGIASFAFLAFNGKRGLHFEKASFTMHKTTSNQLPNTVVFKYNIEGVNADSFFIQQSWDKDRRVRIDPKSHTLTDIYYEPGYHVAKLIANDQVIRTVDVSIPTNGWFYYARERKGAAIPEYVVNPGFQRGILSMSKEEVEKAGIDINKEYVYLQVYFPADISYSSDNYVLNCRIRMNQLRNNFCPFIMSEVFCQKNFMFFKSTPKGCTSEAKAQFGEKILSGKTTDLSALGTDVHQWQDVEIIVKNKHVDVFINTARVLSTTFNESSGAITGLGFLSNGLAEVDFVSLKTIDGKDIYVNDFNK